MNEREDMLLLTAGSASSLEELAVRVITCVEQNDDLTLSSLALACPSDSTGHRLAVVAESCKQVRDELIKFLAGEPTKNVVVTADPVGSARKGVVFAFSGQGGHWPKMGAELVATEPVFRQTVHEVDRLFQTEFDISVLSILDRPQISMVDEVQPTIFTMQVALAALLRAWGVTPAAMVGHSLGEIAAAVCAGALTLEDGVWIVGSRSVLMKRLGGRGLMASLDGSPEQIREWVARYPGRIAIAAVNGPRTIVVSGDKDAIESLLADLVSSGANVTGRTIGVDVAYHSHHIDELRAELERVHERVRSRAPTVPVISSVTGAPIGVLDPAYWWNHARRTVQFHSAIANLSEQGHRVYLEIGPHPVLANAIAAASPDHVVLPTMRRGAGRTAVVQGLAGLGVRGLWRSNRPSLSGAGAARPVTLPALTTAMRDRHRRSLSPASFAAASVEDRTRIARTCVRDGVARALRTSSSTVDMSKSALVLGVDSLASLELSKYLQDALGVSVSPTWLLGARSLGVLVEEIAAPVTPGLGSGDGQGFRQIEPDPARRHEAFPLLDLQQAYWVGQKTPGTSCHLYFEREAVDLDLARFEAAWQRLVTRHDMLRAVTTPDGQWLIHREVPPYRIAVTDLSSHSPEQAERIVEATRARMANRSPAFETWPTFEIRAHRLANRRLRLHFAVNLLALDFKSWVILERELQQLYEAPERELAPLALSFRDYAIALSSAVDAPPVVRARAYWEPRIATLPKAPSVPYRPNGREDATATTVWGHHRVAVDAAQWRRVKEHGASFGLTPAMVICAAYAELLSVFSEESHFTLNLLVQNRYPMHPEVGALVARLSSTSLLEVDFRAPLAFAERAAQLQRQFSEDFDHRYVGGVSLARALIQAGHGGPGATAPNQAPFPVVFASCLGTEAKDSVPLAWVGALTYRCLKTPQVSLDHQVYDHDGGIISCWDLDENAFRPGVVAAMLDGYKRLVERLADRAAWDEVRPARTRAIDERAAGWTATEVPSPSLLHAPFAAQVRRVPQNLAVISSRRTLTYAELDRASNALAARLRASVAGPDTLIAVAMEKGWEQVVAALAVLKAGAAYLPIDTALIPEARLLQILAQTNVKTVVSQSWVQPTIPWPRAIDVIAIDDHILCEHAAPLPPTRSPDDLAYVIFTSGSTGAPKGVMMQHGAAMNTIADINARFGVCERDRVLALSSLGFDLSVWDIFGMLACGGAIVIPEAAHRMDPPAWMRLVADQGVTVWNSVPKLAELFVEEVSSRGQRIPADLRLVMMSGDWIPVPLPAAIRSIARRDIELISLGGATEAAIWSNYYRIGDVDPTWPSIPYGKALLHQSLHVLDADLNERETWVAGDLYIGGAGLARGYWGDAELTAARFVRHPVTGARLYRTGDRGRYLSDGNIEFLGRRDAQVKIHGNRIELGEIESTLNRHPAVQESCVLPTASPLPAGRPAAREQQIIAYVVLRNGFEATVGALRAHLGQWLPIYATPSVIVAIDAIPLSANGKVDRSALPPPGPDQPVSETDVSFTAPRDEIEERIAAICGRLLVRESLSVTQDLFHLGCDSLTAIRISAGIRAALGIEIATSALFDGKAVLSIERLADLVRRGGARPARPLVPIQPSGKRRPLFLVHPVGGTVFCYVKLSKLLDPDQPLFGLQTIPLPDRNEDLVELATRYLDEIRTVQPTGPYRIGGWSLGGIVAFEIARQLRAAGESVDGLLLIDSFAPGTGECRPAHPLDALDWFIRDLCGSLDAGSREADAVHADLEDTEHAVRAYHRLVANGAVPGLSVKDFLDAFAVYRYNVWAGRRYAGGQFTGRLTLLRANTIAGSLMAHPALRNPAVDDPSLGWSRWVSGPIHVKAVPGDHYSMFSDAGLAALATSVTSALQRFDLQTARAVAPHPTGEERL